MDFNINIRLNQLDNFQQFIDDSRNNLSTILENLGWSSEIVQKDNELVKCVHNKTHLVAAKNLDSHQKICSLRSLGYHIDDIQLSEPSINSNTSIIIDNESKIKLFESASQSSGRSSWNGKDPDPKTSDRFISTFSSHERLALYNYAVSATKGPPVAPEFNMNQSIHDNKELTYEELLELNRNLKRRRVKYKSVHTNHKNHTEVIREVINNQMDIYRECINDYKQLPKTSMKLVESKDGKEEIDSSIDESQSVASRQSNYSTQSYQKSRDDSHDNSIGERKHRFHEEKYRDTYSIYKHRDRSKESLTHSEKSDRSRGNKSRDRSGRSSSHRSRDKHHDDRKKNNEKTSYSRNRHHIKGGNYRREDSSDLDGSKVREDDRKRGRNRSRSRESRDNYFEKNR